MKKILGILALCAFILALYQDRSFMIGADRGGDPLCSTTIAAADLGGEPLFQTGSSI